MLDKTPVFLFFALAFVHGVSPPLWASDGSQEPVLRVFEAPGPAVAERTRLVHGVLVVRRHGNDFKGYGAYTTDREAHPWLSFAAIPLPLLDRLTERSQRAHEAAQVKATEADVGHVHAWRDDDASGEVVAVREGSSTTGRLCREFEHTILVGDQRARARALACQEADGVWEIIATSPLPGAPNE